MIANIINNQSLNCYLFFSPRVIIKDKVEELKGPSTMIKSYNIYIYIFNSHNIIECRDLKFSENKSIDQK